MKEYDSMEAFYEVLTEKFVPDAYSDKEIGGWKFTTIDVYYIIERWNNTCGPYGFAWGVKTPVFKRATNEWSDNIYCHGMFFYLINLKEVGKVYNIQFEAVGHGSRNEGEKKSLTNLISKASSYVGIGMDVFKGEHQDDPYVDEGATRLKKPVSNAEPSNAKATTATTGTREKLTPLGIKNEFQSSLPPAVKGKAGLVDIGSIIADMYGQPKEKILSMNQDQLNDLRFDIQKNRDKYLTRVKELIK